MDQLNPPEDVSEFLAAPRTLLAVEQLLERAAFEGGFVLAGADGAGKASLAFLLAATILSGGRALGECKSEVRALVSAGSHPDLRTLRRTENEKTGKLRAEIDVEQARQTISHLHKTSASGRSVIIVDLADDLGRAAANSLLKVLEEPPRGACLFLLSRSPSRLLPTLTSRCRTIQLRAVEEEPLAQWLRGKTDLSQDAALTIARDAGGAPGRALRLAMGEGEEAIAMAESFLRAVEGRQDLLAASRKFAAKGAEATAAEAREIILTRLRRRLSDTATPIEERHRQLSAYDEAQALLSKQGTADTTQTFFMAGMKVRDALKGARHVR